MEIDEKGNAKGELLESWETKPGATEWVFNVRKGIQFHSGKTLDADDIIYSLNLHRGETKSAAKDLLAAITRHQEAEPQPDRDHAVERQRRPALQPHRLSHSRRAERLQGLVEARRHGRLPARELRAGRARPHQEHRPLLEAEPRLVRLDRTQIHPGRLRPHPGADLGPDRRRQPARSEDRRLRAEVPEGLRAADQGHRQPLRLRGALRHRPVQVQRPADGAEIRHRPAEDRRHRLQGLCFDRQRHDDRAGEQVLCAEYAAPQLRSRQGGLTLEEGRQPGHRAAGVRRRLLGRDRRRRALPGGDEEGRHRPATSSASQATATGTTCGSRRRSAPSTGAAVRPSTCSCRRPSSRLRTGTTRIGATRSSTRSSWRRASNSTKASASRCTPTPST